MLTRLTDFILGREPVVAATGLAGVVTAAFGLLHAFDVLRLTPEQVAAVGAFLAVVAGWAARKVVSPVVGQTERQVKRLKQELADEAGGFLTGLAVLVVLVVFGFVACLAITDENENGMAPISQTSDRPPPTYHEDPFPITVTSAPPVAAEIGEPAAEERLPETAMAPMDNNPCKGSCEGKQGDCREVEEGGHCEDNDASPSFQDSPVDHSFNPVICVLPDSCRFEGRPA
jgi:hypothetical protein